MENAAIMYFNAKLSLRKIEVYWHIRYIYVQVLSSAFKKKIKLGKMALKYRSSGKIYSFLDQSSSFAISASDSVLFPMFYELFSVRYAQELSAFDIFSPTINAVAAYS